ncbi:MAG: cadherin, partial [Candidatus Eisenbacteria bacterium]
MATRFSMPAAVTALLLLAAGTNADVIYVDADATGADDGTSWTHAFVNLQSALASADSSDEVWVAQGTYVPGDSADRLASFELRSGLAIYGGFAGTETLREQRDVQANQVILSGDIGVPLDSADNSYHVVGAENVDSTAMLDGFLIEGGNANLAGPEAFGGGICIYQGNPTLANLVFSANSSRHNGGGMYGYSSSPTLTNVIFRNNSALDDGGGICSEYGDPLLTNVLFEDNTADQGGGMYSYFGRPELVNATFHDNFATHGGGGGLYGMLDEPTLFG